MSTPPLIILIVVLLLVFGGGGSYYWRRGRYKGGDRVRQTRQQVQRISADKPEPEEKS